MANRVANLILALLLCITVKVQTQCILQGNGVYVDLTSLSSSSAGYVTSQPGQFYWEYVINVCKPLFVTCATSGSGFYAIQRKAAEPHDDCNSLSGRFSSNVQLSWTDSTNQKSGGVTVTYSGGAKTDSGLARSAVVKIECNPQQTQPSLTFDREDTANAVFYFQMSAREACGKDSPPPTPSPKPKDDTKIELLLIIAVLFSTTTGLCCCVVISVVIICVLMIVIGMLLCRKDKSTYTHLA